MDRPSTERWSRIQAAFDAVVELNAAERAAALEQHCGGDIALRAEVEALLRADELCENRADFIEAAVARAGEEIVDEPSRVGEVVGPYRLVQELGQGGMGVVYLAERADTEYRARVAVKFLRGGFGSHDLERRFRAERQILADLAHPNIARLLDAGTASDASLYLVMEYIDGVPLDRWCDERRLGVRERITLFRQVCVAVQHAHQALVVHRDLKPANILVTADGTPKLLDFGIAKVLAHGSDEDETQTFLRVMTPSHASPEQLRGDRVTAATDIYSLGVVLYQLLTGLLPFEIAGRPIAEIERQISAEDPPRPSAHAPADRVRALRGDLDNIIIKALRKEPERRYGAVVALSEDLRRHLSNEPVSARPDTMLYRAGTFVRRHVIGLSATTVIVALLAALTITSFVQAGRLATARDRATQRQATAERVTDFLVQLFEAADPNVSRGNAITARQMLDDGAKRISTELRQEPAVRASLASVMGEVYRKMGLYDAARALTDSALAIRRSLPGPKNLDLAAALYQKGELLYTEGKYDSADVVHRQALAIRRSGLAVPHAEIAASLNALASTLDELNKLTESEQLYRDALAMDRTLFGAEHEAVASDMTNLAAVLRSEAKYREAIDLLRVALATRRRLFGDPHLEVANTLNQLSRTLALDGQLDEAVPLAREGLAMQRRIHHGPHPETAASLGALAGMLSDLGRYDESEAARRESLAMLRAVFPAAHPYIAATMNSLGDLLLKKGDLSGAEVAYREALALHRRVLAAKNPNIGYPLTGLGTVLLLRGRARDAEPLLREAYALRLAGLPEGHWHTAASASALGACLTELAKYAEAESMLASSLAVLERTFGPKDPRAALARERLAHMYERSGRSAEASRARTGGA